VFGGINDSQTSSMFIQTVPMTFESKVGNRFDVLIPTKDILNVFNIYRHQSKEANTDVVQITLCCDDNSYDISFLEKVSNKGSVYEVKHSISGINNAYNNVQVDIQLQKLPSYLRKIKCPTQILDKILSNMSDMYTNITLICTRSSLIVQNDKYYAEIIDESITSTIDEDSYIILDLSELQYIINTSKSKFIDMYFTGENIIAFSNQHDTYLFTFYMQSSVR
jgi:hypothetical protein